MILGMLRVSEGGSMKQHGGDIYTYMKEYGKKPLDFSANINPLGLPDSVKEALNGDWDRYCHYPDVQCRELRDKVADYEGVTQEYLYFGNGAADVLYRLVLALKPQKALVLAPTFSEYENALKVVECEVLYHRLNERDGYQVTPRIIEAIDDVDLVILCNPNNPTGVLSDKGLLMELVASCGEKGTTLLIDECFMDFVVDKGKYSMASELESYRNLVILKAFTKIFAMAGIRLGYCLTSDALLVERLHEVGQPWNVSVPAQVAGVAAVEDTDYMNRTPTLVEKERDFLQAELKALDLDVYDCRANYVFFKASQTTLKEDMRDAGFLIRSCSNYEGLDKRYYRVAVKEHEVNQLLIGALKKCLS